MDGTKTIIVYRNDGIDNDIIQGAVKATYKIFEGGKTQRIVTNHIDPLTNGYDMFSYEMFKKNYRILKMTMKNVVFVNPSEADNDILFLSEESKAFRSKILFIKRDIHQDYEVTLCHIKPDPSYTEKLEKKSVGEKVISVLALSLCMVSIENLFLHETLIDVLRGEASLYGVIYWLSSLYLIWVYSFTNPK